TWCKDNREDSREIAWDTPHCSGGGVLLVRILPPENDVCLQVCPSWHRHTAPQFRSVQGYFCRLWREPTFFDRFFTAKRVPAVGLYLLQYETVDCLPLISSWYDDCISEFASFHELEFACDEPNPLNRINMSKIVTLTINPALDKSCSVDHVIADHKLRCSEPVYHPGGGGINVARAIHNLGGEATAYWTCGGVVGMLLKQLLDLESVPNVPIPIDGMTRENLTVFDESSGQQYRFGMPGAKLTAQTIQGMLDLASTLVPSPEFLVLSGSLPPGVSDDFYATVAATAPAGCRLILDASGEALRNGLETPVFLIKPSLRELGQLTGRAIENDTQVRELAKSLIDAGKVKVVVTSLGPSGAIITTADLHEHIRAPITKIRSRVGAGDSMVAGIVYWLSQGRELLEAVRFGVAAGSASVMREGTELCQRSDTERLYHEMNKLSR
ncbi:MAG: 1-phosphofructokinase family hexose kinase, partial [Pirellula sp.]